MSDDDLRARLRAADPAASLPTADPDRAARLLEATMTDLHTDESRTDGTHHRSPLTWLVAAAAVALIAAGIGFAIANRNDTNDAGTNTAGDAPAPTQTVTPLRVGDAPAGRCLPPNANTIGRADVAFDGVVTSISGGVVTLDPSRFYTGDATDLVTVRAPSQDLQALLAAVRFEESGRYLVSAVDGQVTLCAMSATYSPALAQLYEQAFAG